MCTALVSSSCGILRHKLALISHCAHHSDNNIEEYAEHTVTCEDAKRQAQRKIDHIVKTKPNMTNDEISDEVEQFWAIGLSCKLCKKPHDATILHALGWGYWKNCASKADRPLVEDYTRISAALTYLGICLTESGRHAEALEVQRAFVAWTVQTTGSKTVEEVIRNSR